MRVKEGMNLFKSIRIMKTLVKPLLWLSSFMPFIVVCKGYGEDYENYTELVWKDDCDIDFIRDEYLDFQVWMGYGK